MDQIKTQTVITEGRVKGDKFWTFFGTIIF